MKFQTGPSEDRQSRTESNHRSDEIPIPTGQILLEVTQESSACDEISNQSIENSTTIICVSCGNGYPLSAIDNHLRRPLHGLLKMI